MVVVLRSDKSKALENTASVHMKNKILVASLTTEGNCMKKMILSLSVFATLSTFANVAVVGPKDNIELKEGSKVGYEYKESYTKKGILSIRAGYEYKYTVNYAVKTKFNNKSEICNAENVCYVLEDKNIYSVEENTTVETADGNKFSIGDRVLFGNNPVTIVGLSSAPEVYYNKGLFKKEERVLDRAALLKYDDGTIIAKYLTLVSK